MKIIAVLKVAFNQFQSCSFIFLSNFYPFIVAFNAMETVVPQPQEHILQGFIPLLSHRFASNYNCNLAINMCFLNVDDFMVWNIHERCWFLFKCTACVIAAISQSLASLSFDLALKDNETKKKNACVNSSVLKPFLWQRICCYKSTNNKDFYQKHLLTENLIISLIFAFVIAQF